MQKKQLLISKREKPEKSTSMGEETKNSNEISEFNQIIKENNDNINDNSHHTRNNQNNKEEQTTSYEVKILTEKEKTISTDDLTKELEELKQKLKEERNKSIIIINELNLKDNELNKEINNLYKKFKILIQKLKIYDKSLVLKTKLLSKISRTKITEKELKDEIIIKEAQIKLYEKMSYFAKNNYEKLEKNAKKKKDKENTLSDILSKIKNDIEALELQNQKLKIIYNIHLNCEKENKLLIDKYHILETDYNYELKRAKQLDLIKIKEKEEDDEVIEEEYDQLDEKAKAQKDAKFLPQLKILKYKGEKLRKLEEQILRINKIGQIKNNVEGNAIKLYKKIDKIFRNKEYHIIRANSYIRKNRKIDIVYDDNYLFSENDAKIMEKVIPEKMLVNYKNKYNDILQYKIETQKNINKKSDLIKNESEKFANKFEYRNNRLKDIKMDKLILIIKSQKLRDKINILKRKIKEIKEQIIKEEKKLQEKDNKNKRIYLFFKDFADNKNKEAS